MHTGPRVAAIKRRRSVNPRGIPIDSWTPGTGKSHFCLQLIEKLKYNYRVEVVSKTWVASQRINGVTADHWIRKFMTRGTPRVDYIFIDELSQLDIGLLTQFTRLLMLTDRPKFVLSGDFNQFAPIGNVWQNTNIADDAFKTSSLLFSMSGGNVLKLTECKRSESALFDIYTQVLDLPPFSSQRNFSIQAPVASTS